MIGTADFERLGRELPEWMFLTWKAHWAREPRSRGVFYRFLGHAFCKLAQAFHSHDIAFGLRWYDFVLWERPDDADDEDGWMDDADSIAYYETHKHLFDQREPTEAERAEAHSTEKLAHGHDRQAAGSERPV